MRSIVSLLSSAPVSQPGRLSSRGVASFSSNTLRRRDRVPHASPSQAVPARPAGVARGILLLTVALGHGATAAFADASSAPLTEPLASALEASSRGFFTADTAYSSWLFDRQNAVTDKPARQLRAAEAGDLEVGQAVVGVRFIGSWMRESTSDDGKFPILSRLPPSHKPGTAATEVVLNDLSIQGTWLPSSWLILFAQGEYTEVEYPGQDDLQLRKYTVTVGDLDRFPGYLTFGRNTVSFGNFSSYAPFTHNHSSHYFWAQSDDPHLELGYLAGDLHIAASLIQNDRGQRVLNSPDSSGAWENFAFSVRQGVDLGEGSRAEVGGGFLRGTIYDSTLAHHPPAWTAGDNKWNGAWNMHGTVSHGPIDLNAEFTRTLGEWPATGDEVWALSLQWRYRHHLGSYPAIGSLMFSRGRQGEPGTEWEKMDQLVLGYEVTLVENLSVGVEYLYNKGFVPLINPRVVSDWSVESHTGIVGIRLTL